MTDQPTSPVPCPPLTCRPLTSQRSAFDLPPDICWLNSAYMSPLLHSVKRAGQAGLDVRSQPWTIRPELFFEPAERVRSLFAQLVNASADDIALVPSVSYGVGIAANAFPIQAGQNIVTVREQFPSNVYPWRKLAETRQATLRPVDVDDWQWTPALQNAIDEHTAIVAIPHIHWTNGCQFDLAAIAKRARDVGAALLVDATQSLGVVPLDVHEIQPDFVVATAYKCLLGPYGLTYVYVAPKWQTAEPLEEGWLNRANAADFSQLTEYCDSYMPGARRFDVGERANSVLLPMAIAALEQLLEWTPSRIAATTAALIEQIVAGAGHLGLAHPPIENCSPCMVGIGLPGESPNDLGRKLAEAGVFISVRKQNARIAAHIYNSAEDVDRLFETLQPLIGRL